VEAFQLPDINGAGDFSAIDPLDGRYYDPETAKYLSERSRVAYQAYVEAALAYALAEFGICSKEIARSIEKSARKVTAEQVAEEEKNTKHDVKALVNCIKGNLDDKAKPYVHFGATSNDIVATALSLQLKNAMDGLVLPRLLELEKTLLGLTKKYASTKQIGRTHGQHAVPVTFGFALAEYVSRLGQNILALREASDNLYGKFSGAVGAYNALSLFTDDPVKFESFIMGSLKLRTAPYSSQIVPADCYVRLIDELSITGGIMANLSHDMRHLQRSEIAEVRESFDKNQTGSSTMAHKRNPWNFENIISLNKQVMAQIISASLNLVSEHQRDLTDSASARYYGTVLALIASMASRLNKVMGKIEVDAENIQKNLYLSGGAIAAEPLYLLLEKYGHTEAHEVAKKISQDAIKKGRKLFDAVKQSEEIKTYVSKMSDKELSILKDPEANYSGLAEKKALSVHDVWMTKLFNA
jgi:adenylosuccinate lyase